MLNKRVYISGALMGAQDLDRVKKLYEEVASICMEHKLIPYLPHKNTDPIKNSEISDEEVYKKDLNELLNSSLVVSYVGEPSLGVGAEIAICIENKIPVITLTENTKKVSRFLKGLLETSDNYYPIIYDGEIDLRRKLLFSLSHFSRISTGHTSLMSYEVVIK